MKRILTIFLGAVMAAACSEKVGVDTLPVSGIRLDLSASALPTKADAPGEDAYNENKIGTIHYFIYTEGNTSSAPVKDGVISVNATASRTVMIPLLDTDFEQLIFPEGATSAEIFVLANCDESLIESVSTKSVDNLKAMTVAFADADAIQSSFVMWGQGEVANASSGSTYSATSSVSLKRVASKITLTIDVAASVVPDDVAPEGTQGGTETPGDVDPDDVWTPVLSNMIVEFNGGANNCMVDGTELESPTINAITRDSKYKAASELVDNKYRMTDKPFYSYSRSWVTGSNDEAYFLITLGWQKGEAEAVQTRTCYYKVVFKNVSFDSNCWYDLTVAISAMPSEGTVTEIRPLEFKVADWSDSITSESGSGDDNYNTQVDINGTRFLTIENSEYILYNQESIDIPVKSSHPIKVVSVTPDSENNKKLSQNLVDVTPNNTVDANVIDRSITFSHVLENDQTQPEFDYKEYKYTVVVQHSTGNALDSQYQQTITIIQRPALCISLEDNTNGQGTVYVDGLVRPANKSDAITSTYRANGGGGSFQKLTKVSVSVLPEDSDYIIGDPRSRTNMVGTSPWISNSDPFINTSAPHVSGATGQRLTYYYPTSTDSSMENVIAPEFIICSGFGGGGVTFSFADAELRCSSYQEHGYPAGRWRLPTEAELLYAMRLQKKGYIEQVYSNQNYWSSTKSHKFSDLTVYTGNSNTRCVYDTWFWDNTDYPKTASPYTTFTWGDAEIY